MSIIFKVFVVDTRQESVAFLSFVMSLTQVEKTIILIWKMTHQIFWTGYLDNGIQNSGKGWGMKLNIQTKVFLLKGVVLEKSSIWSSVCFRKFMVCYYLPTRKSNVAVLL